MILYCFLLFYDGEWNNVFIDDKFAFSKNNNEFLEYSNSLTEILINNGIIFLKSDFKKDIGLDVNSETMSMYLQYLNARFSDANNQLLQGLIHELLNKVNFLPGEISLKIGEMINQNYLLKDLASKMS